MKKTSKELLDFFGLEVGDRVVIDAKYKYEVKYFENYIIEYRLVKVGNEYDAGEPLIMLMNHECGYEIVKPKKKVGNMRCIQEILCGDCPLKHISCGDGATPYEVLNDLNDGYNLSRGIYKAYKAELDKEVSEDECK